jgi:L-amino acid N-acyltransferase YncA
MNALIRPVSEPDWNPITAIFNYFVTESFAAYPNQPVDAAFFRDRHAAHPMFPFVVAEIEGEVVGFAYLSPFHPVPTMRQTANLTYFLHPEFTGRGIGATLLEHLLEAGKTLSITNFMAHVSSLNPGSVRFHLAHGFTYCVRFLIVGVKNGRSFDMVWLQKQQA